MKGFTPGPAPDLGLYYTFQQKIAPGFFIALMAILFVFMFGPRNGLILIASMAFVVYVANHFDQLSALAMGR